ncbi:MAG: hypothetical protein BroJett033_0150 [Chloroflexota bacterium]|nr:MAG: hypothetical protein BroJett033_0150 [Chloroflexota bacterium]
MLFEAEAPKIVSIFALAFFSFWTAIPAGLALGLAPPLVIATTTLSYVCGAALVLLPGERVRAWVLRRFNRQAAVEAPPGALRRAWERWGAAGLGLLGPMTVGAQIGAALGLALNARPRALLLWMTLGALAWSVLLTLAVTLGVLGARAVL